MKTKLLGTILIIALGACTRLETLRDWTLGVPPPETTTLLGLHRTVGIGEIVTASRPLIIQHTLQLKSELLATDERRGVPLIVRLQPGIYTRIAEDGDTHYYASPTPFPTTHGDESLIGYGGMLVSAANHTPLGAYWLWSSTGNPLLAYKAPVSLASDLSEGFGTTIAVNPDADGPVASLRFAGVRDDQILFLHQADASTETVEEVALHCAAGETCTFHNARFVVHAADADHFDYTLLSSL